MKIFNKLALWALGFIVAYILASMMFNHVNAWLGIIAAIAVSIGLINFAYPYVLRFIQYIQDNS